MTDGAAVEAAIASAHRREWARVLAATARVTRDLDLDEECVQEAYAAAMQTWVRDGIPDNPAAWLTTTAKRRAIDAIRRDKTLRSRLPLLVEPEEAADRGYRPGVLVSEPTVAARVTRAKKKISAARIPYRVPRPAELPDRLRAVLAVIHLLFTNSHTAPSGASLVRAELVDRALHLARMLGELMPDDTEVRGLCALLLVTNARRAARADADGRLVRLKEQDRSALADARDMILDCLRAGPTRAIRPAGRDRIALCRGANVRPD